MAVSLVWLAPLLLVLPAKDNAWVGVLGPGGPEAAEAGGDEPRNKDTIAMDVGPSEER